MKFSSLSEAVLYYTSLRSTVPEYFPYSSLAQQTQQQPVNTIYLQQSSPDVITYGVTIWGTGKIIDKYKPSL